MEYQIGEFSQICRLSIKTLRYYHDIGILRPVRVSSDSGYRYYDEQSLERARVIRELRALGFSLKEIQELLATCEDDADLREHLAAKSRQIKQQIRSYRDIDRRLHALLTTSEESRMKDTGDTITIKEVPAMLVASIRFTGKYEEVGRAFGAICRCCGRHAAGKPFSLYYDAEYKEEDADIEACVPVSREVNHKEVTSRSLPGGRAVTIVHRGPYETLGESYKLLLDHVKKQNLAITRPSREIYHKGPGMIFRGNPRKYVTEIQFLLRDAVQ
jgi:effector-binding domain-containing protein